MTKQPIISRRLLLAGLWLAGSCPAWALDQRGDDQGIGGTGIIRRNDDRGIGGTGIVGVIQRFGSIFVNGERISYAPNVPVLIDGAATSAKALRIGQVVRVLALRQANGMLTTRGIAVVSEVVGPIENVNTGEITVLGQKVISAGSESWRRPGTQVAVFGLRRTDGVIVASLVEPRRDNATRVAGLLERDRGALRIGGLRLDGAGRDASLARESGRSFRSRRSQPFVDRSLCAACWERSAIRLRLCRARCVTLPADGRRSACGRGCGARWLRWPAG